MELAVQLASQDSTIRLFNLSLGGYGYDPLAEELLAEFYALGGISAIAAGNTASVIDDHGAFYPGAFGARIPGVISGGAMDQTGQHLSGFTSWGPEVRTFAIGENVDSGGWGRGSGTSNIAPQIAAIAGLSLLEGRSPWATVQAITFGADESAALTPGVHVVSGGGVMNPEKTLMDAFFVQSLNAPNIITITKAKQGKVIGTTNDLAKALILVGQLDARVKVADDGSFKAGGVFITISPAIITSPSGGGIVEKKVKGL
jgi:hypothetical protein